LPPNTILDGSYRITRVVGVGGFGITYEAEDTNLSTSVAIKEYYPFDFGDRDNTMSVRPKSDRHKKTFDWGRSNFLLEARTLARFEHPSIVRVTRVFEANSTAYMVMRYERGLSFEAWLNRLGRLPTQEELDAIVAPLLEALDMMHAADFLHRDIAPDNIIVRADGSPVLLDFGAARRSVAEMSRTLTGIVKAGYSPHEQYSSNNRLQGPWSDLYALGGTLYRAVTGRPPEEATMRVDEDRMPPAAQAVRKGRYRPAFLHAIDACLKMRHAERPRSVAQLRPMMLPPDVEARPGLERLVDAFRSPSKPSSRPSRSPPSLRTRRTGPPVEEPPATRRRWPLVAALALIVLGGGYGTYEFMRSQSDPRIAEERQRRETAERLRREAEEQERERQAAAARRLDEEHRAAEARRLENERRAAEAKRLEDERRAAEAKRLEDERRTAEARRVEDERRAAEAKRIEDERRAAEAKRVEDGRRAAEAKRQEEERQAAEAKRKEEERQAAEAKRKEDERRAAAVGDAQRQDAERKQREAERIAKVEQPGRESAAGDDVLTPSQDGAVTILAADGDWFATGTDKGTVQLWQLSEGAPARRIGANTLKVGRITAIAFGQDDAGKVAVSDKDGALAFWDVQSNKVQPATGQKSAQAKGGPAKRVIALRYNPAERQFLALSVVQDKGAYQTALERWRPDGRAVGQPKAIKTGIQPPQAGAFARSGELFAVVANGELQLFDASRGDTPIYTEPFSGFARTLAFSPDGRHLAIGGQADQVRVRTVESDRKLARFADLDLAKVSRRPGADVAAITALVFSPDGRLLAAANADNRVAIWDLSAPAKPLAEYAGGRLDPAEPITSLALQQLSPGKTLLVTPWSDGSTRRIPVNAGG
jgi:serine/threonine protein kinase/WD40 repeat protein